MCCYGGVFFSRVLNLEMCTQANKLPTIFLGFMTLHPNFRSNITFAIAFFLTRIVFHIIIGVSYFLHDNRIQATGGSYLPSIIMATVFPFHALWFYGCVKGFYRRASQQHTPILVPTIDELGIQPVERKVSPPPETQSRRADRSRPTMNPTYDYFEVGGFEASLSSVLFSEGKPRQ